MRRNARGFTLIELITVIVILSIIAVIGSQFIVNATESYDTTQNRARLINTGRQALERMTRELRVALPYSAEHLTSAAGECVKFMPIAGDGHYTQPVVPNKSESALQSSFYRVDWGTARYVSIAALSSAELALSYPSALTSLASPIASGNTGVGTLNFSGSHEWLRNSASRRFFFLDRPRAFCLIDGQLLFFPGVGVADQQVPPSGSSNLLADNVTANGGAAFTVGLDTVTNRSLVTLSLVFAHGGESVSFEREVALRNVP